MARSPWQGGLHHVQNTGPTKLLGVAVEDRTKILIDLAVRATAANEDNVLKKPKRSLLEAIR